MKKGDRIFFEGLVYTVTETPTEPSDPVRRVSKLGHFRAIGKRGGKSPTLETDPKHLKSLAPADAQAEIDAEMAQWVASNTQEPDANLRKALQSLTVANARDASVALKKLGSAVPYLPGRLIQPPVARPDISKGVAELERRARKGVTNG